MFQMIKPSVVWHVQMAVALACMCACNHRLTSMGCVRIHLHAKLNIVLRTLS